MNKSLSDYHELDSELKELVEKLKDYPKGTLRRRMIKGGVYYYLQYREGEHVRSRYIHGDDVENLHIIIEERRALEQRIKELKVRLETYARLLGLHRSYRPVKNVDYEAYTLFMSAVAHDYKSLEDDVFIDKYDVSKYRGINKRYIAGFLDYINGIDRGNMRKTNDLVLDPYTYLMYFKYGKKEVLTQEVQKAIPAFLNRGLLITNIQEAVRGTFGLGIDG